MDHFDTATTTTRRPAGASLSVNPSRACRRPGERFTDALARHRRETGWMGFVIVASERRPR